jgi:tRNA threonylcarbamoyladenosine biosynthesis protein TsaB
MSLILNIDTATEAGAVAIALEGTVLAQSVSVQQRDHAAWIHVAINEIMHDAGYSVQDLKAVAIVAGPGSYTGLRVGMATAKGLCYALKIPLITLNTLKVMAYAASKNGGSTIAGNGPDSEILLCPMLDARRMEVFTALYDVELNEILPPCAMILEPGSFDKWLTGSSIVFFGNGSDKWKRLVNNPLAFFSSNVYGPDHVSSLSQQLFTKNEFTDLAYSEPIYLKDFYTHHRK